MVVMRNNQVFTLVLPPVREPPSRAMDEKTSCTRSIEIARGPARRRAQRLTSEAWMLVLPIKRSGRLLAISEKSVDLTTCRSPFCSVMFFLSLKRPKTLPVSCRRWAESERYAVRQGDYCGFMILELPLDTVLVVKRLQLVLGAAWFDEDRRPSMQSPTSSGLVGTGRYDVLHR